MSEKEEEVIEKRIKEKEEELDALIDNKEGDIETLKDIAYDLRVKRIADEKKEADDLKRHDFGLTANHPDKPCRAMREGIPLTGDLPGLAPRGKCYYDHQKDCNAWCTCWEGDEDNEEVKKIREIQKHIEYHGQPNYKVVEDWDADKIAEIKQEQLEVQTEKIAKEAIQKVILAGIELFIVGDLEDVDAIKEIEACLKKLKRSFS